MPSPSEIAKGLLDPDTAAITVPLDLFKRLVDFAERANTHRFSLVHVQDDVDAARREIEQVEALLGEHAGRT